MISYESQHLQKPTNRTQLTLAGEAAASVSEGDAITASYVVHRHEGLHDPSKAAAKRRNE